MSIEIFKPAQQERLQGSGRIAGLIAAVLLIATPYLKWSYSADALDNMSFLGGPSPLQLLFLVLAVVLVVLLACPLIFGRRARKESWLSTIGWNRGARAAATGALLFVLVTVAAIAIEAGGLVNLEVGAWVALVLAVLAWVATRTLPRGPEPRLHRVRTPNWLFIAGIVVVMAATLFGAAFALNQDEGGSFVVFAMFLIALVLVARATGVLGWLHRGTAENRKVLILAAFLVAFAFPFTQNGSDANMSIASQVLIFAAAAMGLNIVVGLAGLLDLGYIAFLGAGAFTAAVLSRSAFATFFHWKPPFLLVALIAGVVSALLGLLIGSPTLRVSGDYLAIVTLAFGEIFRIGMNNLDGSDGPDVTHGSNGIPGIPDLQLPGFDFGESHTIVGIEIGRFANYYWLMLLVIGLIILVFANLNHSRIGRGWVAVREDEKAAEAMGVNVFGLKLLAFAGGAFLAGIAGSVKAHQDVSVTPDQYIFLESAFLLAAIVLGGMGTILGVLAGATILKLLPEKLRFVNDLRLLLFGLLLVLMMRFRPEGLVADERRQLEFHDDDEELAEEVEEEMIEFRDHLNMDPKEPA